MAKAMVACGVELDQRVIWAFDVGVVESWDARKLADVGERREESCAAVKLLLIRGFHILRTPTEMPDRGSQFPGRGLGHLCEKQPGILSPHCVNKPRETSLLAI